MLGALTVLIVVLPIALEAWQVMTDYDHMAKFVSNLDESKVMSRTGDTLTVFQKGTAKRGILTFAFENVRVPSVVTAFSCTVVPAATPCTASRWDELADTWRMNMSVVPVTT